MAGYLPAPTFAPAQTVVASDWNTYVRDNLKALASRCLLYHNANFTWPASTTLLVGLSVELYDSPDNMGNVTTHRITIVQPGTYRIRAQAGGPVGGGWTVFIRKNGTTTLISSTVTASSEVDIEWSVPLVATDYLELVITSGASPITGVAQITNRPSVTTVLMSAEWVAP